MKRFIVVLMALALVGAFGCATKKQQAAPATQDSVITVDTVKAVGIDTSKAAVKPEVKTEAKK